LYAASKQLRLTVLKTKAKQLTLFTKTTIKFTIQHKHIMPSPSSSFNIALGCYESILLGLDTDVRRLDRAVRSDGDTTAELHMAFALPSHLGSIRVVASNSKYLVTGSTDEQLK
jgi:hypothetical protein